MGKRKQAHALEGEVDEKDGGSDEEIYLEVKVVGEILKKSGGKGKADKKLYPAFEVDGNRYEIDDAVLVTPESNSQKPYVAIIKEIKQAKDGTVHITGQWFYRPEEAEKKGGGTWPWPDSRELFYSFHIDEVPAESVMHKCQVHFIPPNKQLPLRSKHPGFIVRRVYDACEKKLFNLTDKDYEDPMQKEIDRLVERTRETLGDLPDIDGDENTTFLDKEASPDLKSNKRRVPLRKTMAPLNVKSDESTVSEPKSQGETPNGKADAWRAETPTSCVSTDTEASTLLKIRGVLLGVHARDRWLEKLMQTIWELCGGGKVFNVKNGGEEGLSRGESNGSKAEGGKQRLGRKKSFLGEGDLAWPEVAAAAVEVVSALEKLSHDSLGNDLHKYNLKMRQLDFNVKNNKVLARRLLAKELEPATVINMSPAELKFLVVICISELVGQVGVNSSDLIKDGYIAAEKNDQEPPEQETIQMADVRCSICTEREVGVRDIIHVGSGDRYQLECLKCGNTWYSSRDAISSIEIKTTATPNVGIAPWATSKFEEVEKDATSPGATQVPQSDGTVSNTDNKQNTNFPTMYKSGHIESALHENLPIANTGAKEFVNMSSQEAMDIEPVPQMMLSSSGGNASEHKALALMENSLKPALVTIDPNRLRSFPSEKNLSGGPQVSTMGEEPTLPVGHQGSTIGAVQSVPISRVEGMAGKQGIADGLKLGGSLDEDVPPKT